MALPTAEAEFMVGTEATKEAVWIPALLSQLCDRPVKCVLRGDNQGSLALAANPVFHQRTKHITEMVNNGRISIQYVPTAAMYTDGFLSHYQRIPTGPIAVNLDCVCPPTYTFDTDSTKRKISCTECGNLFPNNAALHRHQLKKC